MKRRPYGRDIGLTIRMGIALLPIVLWYLLMLALFVLITLTVIADPSWELVVGLVLFGVGGPFALWKQLMDSESVALRAARAKEVERGEREELQSLVARVAAQADLPAPRVAIARSRAPNAFSVGVTERRAVVAFTTELLRGAFLLFYWPIYFVGLLAMWTLSRNREYIADRGAALITGAPEQLMSALQKLGGRPPRGDLRGGLAVQALCILPARSRGWRRFELLGDHPPLEKRLERLEELSRELGEAA